MARKRHDAACRCTTCQPDYLAQRCAAAGERLTAPRRALWDWLSCQRQGFTVAAAAAELSARGVGQATVYRTLALYERLGLVRRVSLPGGRTGVIAVQPGHSHALICEDCGRVQDFEDCGWNLLSELLALKSGYALRSHYLEVRGRCPRCQQKD